MEILSNIDSQVENEEEFFHEVDFEDDELLQQLTRKRNTKRHTVAGEYKLEFENPTPIIDFRRKSKRK
jgi:hypothetical protein